MPVKLSVFAVEPASPSLVSGASSEPRLSLFPLPTPRGLISPYESPVWKFQSHAVTGMTSIKWDRELPDGSRLTDRVNEMFLDSAKRFLTILIENPCGWFSITSTSTALHRTYIFLSVIEWAVRLGYRSLSQVTWQDWVLFRGKLPHGIRAAAGDPSSPTKEAVTDARILDVFRVAQCIYLFRFEPASGMQLMQDGFGFAPFEPGEDPKALARTMGVRPGQTPSIPPPIALHCLDAAIQYIVLYADDIIELNDRLRQESARHGPVRRAPGKFLNEVKHRLIRHLCGEAPLALTLDGRVFRSKLAAQLAVQPSMLSGTSVSRILSDFERALASPDQDVREAFLQRLRLDLSETEDVNRVPRARDMAKRVGLPFWGRQGAAAPWPITAIGSSAWMEGTTLERATANLWTAILIVTETLMADRIGESLSAEVGCTYKGLDGSYMMTSSFKPTNADVGIENGRPCPEVVVLAVDVATRLGASAREHLQTNLLFASEHRLGASLIDETTIRKRLNTFASDVGAPPDEDGEEWQLAPHQLRRFLATTWVWYYELGTGLDALRQHLRQTDITQAVRYAAGDIYAMVTEEQVSLTANILERATYEGLDIFGPFGSRWKRLAAQINVKFVDFEQKEDRIHGLMTSRKMVFHPNPWGYCVWSTKAGTYAKCLPPEERGRGVRRPQNRKRAETCAGCANCVITKVFAAFWMESEIRHERVASQENIPDGLREAARNGAAIARKVRLEMEAA